MNTESNKFAEISDIYPLFTEKNRNRLIRTAKSLLKIQRTSEEMVSEGLSGNVGRKASVKTGVSCR